MKAVTTIKLTKELNEEQIELMKDMIENDPKQLEDALNMIKTVATDVFVADGEEVSVKFEYGE